MREHGSFPVGRDHVLFLFIHNSSKYSPQITTENVGICFLFVLLFAYIPQMSAENFNFYEKTGEILLKRLDEFSNFMSLL